jgi:hypothetical protein
MNTINELNALVDGHDENRIEMLLAAIRDSGLSDVQLEATFAAVNVAFGQYLAAKAAPQEGRRCSFCHRSQRQVKSLVAATTAAICDHCIEIARDTISPSVPNKHS